MPHIRLSSPCLFFGGAGRRWSRIQNARLFREAGRFLKRAARRSIGLEVERGRLATREIKSNGEAREREREKEREGQATATQTDKN